MAAKTKEVKMTINLTVILFAIASVESGGNQAAIGKAGERSQFQMSAQTWNQHAKADQPFTLASAPDGEAALYVAEIHAVWLVRQLEAHHQTVTIEHIYAMWKSPAAMLKGHMSDSVTEKADRVKNVYDSMLTNRPTDAPVWLSDAK